MSNIELASKLVSMLSDYGVREYIVSGGVRNGPLIGILGRAKGIKVYHHHNENSAAFFALGRIKESGRPVAVAVTSGTAAVQLHPACVEAFYSKLPLVLITSDRPKHFRGTAAPQAIDQTDLFGSSVQSWHDISNLEDIPSVESLSNTSPVHFNPCFDEPLLDRDIPGLELRQPEALDSAPLNLVKDLKFTEFIKQTKKPIVSLGRISAEHRDRVVEFLLALGAPVVAESLSGLREDERLRDLTLRSGKGIFTVSNIDSFIRIGSVPTTDFWRDLERNPKFKPIPVMSITPDGFSGLARDSIVLDLNTIDLSQIDSAIDGDWAQGLITKDRELGAEFEKLLKDFPCSELAMVRDLSQKIESDALVYLGNSLPIREWDLAAVTEANERTYEANRGVNGIDGQLSTFLGCSHPKRPNWCILGDLTVEYDLGGFLPMDQLDVGTKLRAAVINNSGGRIFELLPDYSKHFKGTLSGQLIVQERSKNFKPIADYWGIEHYLINSSDDIENLPDRVVLELKPSNEETRSFWAEFRSLFKTD